MKQIYFLTTRTMVALAAVLLLGCSTGGEAVPSVGPEEFQERYENDDNAVILDVRTPREYEQGHIPDAILIDYYSDDFKSELKDLDKSKHYYVYCRSGNRSGKTVAMMEDMGFARIVHLEGGMLDWNGEVEKGR